MNILLTKKVIYKFLIIILVIGLIISIYNYFYNIVIKKMYPLEYSNYVDKYSKENNLDREIIYALIKQESNFKQESVSPKYAMGLMQLLDSTARQVSLKLNLEYETNMLFDPDSNIKIGTKYFAILNEKYNNLELSLAAYNAGTGNVDAWIKNGIIKEDGSDIENIPFKETNNYVRKVINNYKIYKQIYE